VLLRLGRRAIFSGVIFFALVGFVSVPLGDKTGWGHLQAIAETPAASQAFLSLKSSMMESQHRLVGWLTSRLTSQGVATASPSDSADTAQPDISVPRITKHQSQSESTPSPKPPRLMR
jgi:hypothetical protein